MERRNYPRVVVSQPINYHTDIPPRSGVASTLDLGVGGAGIVTSSSLALGEIINISFATPAQLIKCKGEVVHVLRLMGERVKAGVRFEGLSKLDKLYLEECISYAGEHQEKAKPLTGLIIGLGFSLLVWVLIIYVILLVI